jgi:hypothetical protein
MKRRLVTALTAALGLLGTTVAAHADPHGFRLLAPSVKFAGRTRAELLIAGYTAKVLSPKDRIVTRNCAERPQFGDSAEEKALADTLFTLPAELGKRMTCTMPATSSLMIDHIGVICNDSQNHQASVACIDDRFKNLHDYRVTFDGTDLGAQRFKVITEKFVVQLDHDSPFGLNEGKWRLRAGGWPLLLDHLTPGHPVPDSEDG